MYTRFVIVALILLGILSSADARRHHERHRSHTDSHRVYDPPVRGVVLDPSSVFETGTGRVGWTVDTQLYWEPPIKTRVAWVSEVREVPAPPSNALDRLGIFLLYNGVLIVIGSLAIYLMTGMRHTEMGVTLIRCKPNSAGWWNLIRLRLKQAKEFVIQSYRGHTIGTVKRRELSPEEKWDLHHIALF